MEYTTLKEYTYELHMKESIDVVAVFYHGINILSGTPKEIFESVTPSLFVTGAKHINRPYHKIVIVEIDIDESEVQEKWNENITLTENKPRNAHSSNV